MTYKIPPPAWMGDIPGYTADQMQEAYTAGAESMSEELGGVIEYRHKGWENEMRLRLALEQQRNALRALLQRALTLLDKQWKCDGLWSLEDCQELADAIKEELSK